MSTIMRVADYVPYRSHLEFGIQAGSDGMLIVAQCSILAMPTVGLPGWKNLHLCFSICIESALNSTTNLYLYGSL